MKVSVPINWFSKRVVYLFLIVPLLASLVALFLNFPSPTATTEQEGQRRTQAQEMVASHVRAETVARLSVPERVVQASGVGPIIKKETLPKPKGPGHDWTLLELESLTQDGLSGRNFENGRRTFDAAHCIVCHRFNDSGGITGPDLTNLIGRFNLKELAETIVNPSKVIPDQYRNSSVATADGRVFTGRVVNSANGNLTVFTDPEDPNKAIQIPRSDVEDIVPLITSLMPGDLLKPLNREEILDLLAYLMSHGNPADPIFWK